MVCRASAAGHGERKQFTTLVSYANTRARHTSYSVPVGKNSGCRPCFQVSSLPPRPQPRRTSPVSCSKTENSGQGSTRSRTSSVKRTSTYGNIPENFVADPPRLSKEQNWCVLVHPTLEFRSSPWIASGKYSPPGPDTPYAGCGIEMHFASIAVC